MKITTTKTRTLRITLPKNNKDNSNNDNDNKNRILQPPDTTNTMTIRSSPAATTEITLPRNHEIDRQIIIIVSISVTAAAWEITLIAFNLITWYTLPGNVECEGYWRSISLKGSVNYIWKYEVISQFDWKYEEIKLNEWDDQSVRLCMRKLNWK